MSTWLVVAGLLAAAVFAGFVVWSKDQPAPSAASAAPLPEHKAPKQHYLLAIGDSWIEGGTMNSGPTWPFLMDLPDGWHVYADGRGGTGYIGDHPDSALTYAGRLDGDLREYAPDLVLVAMGRNDVQWDPDKVVVAARQDLTAMKKAWPGVRIVVFSPWSPEPPVDWTVTLTARLRALADSLGLPFLDVSHVIGNRANLVESKHPNDAGHAVIAKYVGDQLAQMGVLD